MSYTSPAEHAIFEEPIQHIWCETNVATSRNKGIWLGTESPYCWDLVLLSGCVFLKLSTSSLVL